MSGDVLARGGIRAQFVTTEGKISAEKWNAIFADFDLEKYKMKVKPASTKPLSRVQES